MAREDIAETLPVQTARLRVQFLERELEPTETMIELARFEGRFEGDDATSKSMEHVRQGVGYHPQVSR